MATEKVTYTYKCSKATCRYIETYGKLGSYKCPKCGSPMVRQSK